MAFLLFVGVWIFAGALSSSVGTGLVAAVLSLYIFHHGKRLSRIEAELKAASSQAAAGTAVTPSLASAERATPAPTPGQKEPVPLASSIPAASTGAPLGERKQPAMPPIAAPRPAMPPVSAPQVRQSRSASETLEQILGPAIAGFILRGNPIARVGVVILLFGVVFLLKFASDEGFIPIELRLLGAAFGAFVLLGIGWKKRRSRAQIALTLQGAGAGVFYLTAFIAFRLYHLLPGPLAFVLLVAVTALSAALAVLQNAMALAVLAMVGAFLAPALTSEGGGNHLALFSYLALINLGIFGMCWFRAWRAVNLTGFFFTFVLASLWGASSYRAELFETTEPFLLVFVLLYSIINLKFSRRAEASSPGTLDTLMTFGTPFFGMLLQYGLVQPFEYGMALSAAGFGAFHLMLARYALSTDPKKLRFLVESYFAVGLAFLSLAVPFAFSSRLTGAIWALEAVALIWRGIRQHHLLTRVGGHLLLIGSTVSFLIDVQYGAEDSPFLNPYFLSVALLTISFLLAGVLLQRASSDQVDQTERRFGQIYLVATMLCWCSGGYFEVWRHTSGWYDFVHRYFNIFPVYWVPLGIAVDSVFASLSVLGFWAIGRRAKVPQLGWLRYLLMPLHYFFLLVLLIEATGYVGVLTIHPFNSYGFVAWTLVFAAHYFMLHREEAGETTAPRLSLHLLALWLLTFVLSWEAYWAVLNYVGGGDSWRYAALTIVPCLLILAGTRAAALGKRWPFSKSASCYLSGLALPGAWVLCWPLLLDFCSSANASPLPYLPLLNPLDVAQGLGILTLIIWWRRSENSALRKKLSEQAASATLSAALFVWSTALLFRSAHHYMGVPWNPDSLFDSSFIQSALSIYWSILALVLMLLAHAKAWRAVWKFGALLIAVVVLKLLLIDLSNQGTIARISAFLGVGVLMLVIGYFAPIPPEKKKVEATPTSTENNG